MTDPDFQLDFLRTARIGLPEAVFCQGKSPAQIAAIVAAADARGERLLLTRLSVEIFATLPDATRTKLDHDDNSATAVLGTLPEPAAPARVAVVTAGTTDLPAAMEAVRTLRFC